MCPGVFTLEPGYLYSCVRVSLLLCPGVFTVVSGCLYCCVRVSLLLYTGVFTLVYGRLSIDSIQRKCLRKLVFRCGRGIVVVHLAG